MSGAAAAEEMAPFVRVMLTVCVMMATVMQALDTTIANVALPYMQGSLSTTQDQVNWVLTSYIVAAAIMTSPLGWLATRLGRKKLFIVCAAGFTFASARACTYAVTTAAVPQSAKQNVSSVIFVRGDIGSAFVIAPRAPPPASVEIRN